MKGYWSCMKTVDHSYEQALIMHDNIHIHVITNIIVTPSAWPTKGQTDKVTYWAVLDTQKHLLFGQATTTTINTTTTMGYDGGDYGLDYVDTARHARIGGGAVVAGAPCWYL